MSNPHLIITTALASEARPLIDCYRLSKQQNRTQFDYYINKNNAIQLIVTGIGNLNAAAAASFAFMQNQAASHACFLNVGIAGHKTHSIGELFLAHKITEEISGKSFYPHQAKPLKLASDNLLSVTLPNSDYEFDEMIDMEAYGFFHAASKYVNQEQIQAIKIISDNAAQTVEHINAKFVTDLIQAKITEIETVVQYLMNLSAEEAIYSKAPEYYLECLERWHFSQYQQHELRELLRRWQICLPELNPLVVCDGVNNSKEALNKFRSQLT